MTGRIFGVQLVLAVLVGCQSDNTNYYTSSLCPVAGSVVTVKVRSNIAEYSPYQAIQGVSNVFAKVGALLDARNPESEISVLAPSNDVEVLEFCNPLVKPCYATAFRLREQSGGAFNPRWRGEKTLDLIGIDKSYAMDAAQAASIAFGGNESYVDIDHNVRTFGGKWKVSIVGGEVLTLTNGMACATCGECYRGKPVYDGRTGFPVSNEVYSVTVVHPDSVMLADGLSTICYILGVSEAEAFLKEYYPDARAIWLMKKDVLQR